MAERRRQCPGKIGAIAHRHVAGLAFRHARVGDHGRVAADRLQVHIESAGDQARS